MKPETTDFDTLVHDALSLPFSGWDFSIMAGRWKTAPLSWEYATIARSRMKNITSMLDQDTGGGELLASLAPLPARTWATEQYAPNIPLARHRLEPLGVRLITDFPSTSIPLPDSSLDLILNRHGDYHEPELFRLLKPGGIFLTQQVGGQNCIRLNELLQDQVDYQYAYWTEGVITQQLKSSGFKMQDVREEFPVTEFSDIGAIVFYLRTISWQIADFSVEKYRHKLFALHQDILSHGLLQVREHRILVEARKPG
jgi:SAM-dependent methyltransferase